MRPIAAITLVTALAGLSLAPAAVAQGHGRPKPPEKRAEQPSGGVNVSLQFTVGERDVIAKYFAAHRYKAQRLPPGIAKNLARGKPLPPGIAKRQLPAPLVAELPRRSGVEIAIYGDRLVLLNDRGLVLDIMVNVF